MQQCRNIQVKSIRHTIYQTR